MGGASCPRSLKCTLVYSKCPLLRSIRTPLKGPWEKCLVWEFILISLLRDCLQEHPEADCPMGVSENWGYLIWGFLKIWILLFRVLYSGALISETARWRRSSGSHDLDSDSYLRRARWNQLEDVLQFCWRVWSPL